MFYEEMKERQQYLSKVINYCEKKLKNSPDGMLRAVLKDGVPHYFVRHNKSDINGEYIRKDKAGLAKKLAEKEVFSKLKDEALKEYKDNYTYLKKHSEDTLVSCYEKIPKLKRKLVDSPVMTDEEYVEKWLGEEYEKKGFMDNSLFYVASNGEKVRSKSEVIICDILNEFGIPYLYEAPLILKGVGTVYPDFKLLNVKERKTIYLEHFGMMDNPEYLEGFFRKQNSYVANGIVPGRDIIFSFESSRNPLDINAVRNLLKVYFHK